MKIKHITIAKISLVYFLLSFFYSFMNPLILSIPVKIPATYLSIFIIFPMIFFLSVSQLQIKKIDVVIAIMFALLLPSVVFSYNISVSFFKYIMFAFGIIVFHTMFSFHKIHEYRCRSQLIEYLKYYNRIIVLLSIVTYISGLGYPRNETGFAGVLNHPQSAGIMFAYIALFEFMSLQFRKVNSNLIFFVIAFIFVIMSESRTAFLALLGSICIYITLANMGSYSKTLQRKLLTAISSLIIIILLAPFLIPISQSVLAKGGEEASVFEAFNQSRFFLAYASYLNFMNTPIYGIGFQVSNGLFGHYPMIVEYSSFGVPIKSSIEKGVFLMALLEETGILGFSGFILFLFYFCKSLNYNPISVSFMSCVVLASMGESMLLSFGGIGYISWLYVFVLGYRKI